MRSGGWSLGDSRVAWLTLGLLCAVLGILTRGAAASAPGDLDPSFGSDGVVVTSFGLPAEAHDIVEQPDGKLLVVGFVDDSTVALARYLPSGLPDPDFGNGGWISGIEGRAEAVALQADGKIVTAMSVDGQLAVARYFTDGALDTGFGVGGVAITEHIGGWVERSVIAVQADGRILAGTSVGLVSGNAWGMVRFLSEGEIDLSFGVNGYRTIDFQATYESIRAIRLLADGRILLAGDDGRELHFARLLPNGNPDPTFGGVGQTVSDFGSGSYLADIQLQPDGRFVAVGRIGDNLGLMLARYNSSGSPDSSFGSVGRVTVSAPARVVVRGAGLAIQNGGKILAAGLVADLHTETSSDFFVTRVLANGTLDATFGSNGRSTTNLLGGEDVPTCTLLQEDGRFVVAGYSEVVTVGTAFSLARYLPGNFSPSAGNDAHSIPEDTPLAFTGANDLRANDTDTEGTTLTVSVATPPAHGSLTTPGGILTYTPTLNYFGPDSFTYQVSDGESSSSPATVSLTVTPVNDAPLAGNDFQIAAEDLPISIPTPGVLSNDSDVEGASLSAVTPSQPSHGDVLLDADGSYDYLPAPGYWGMDSFTYRASDGSAQSSPATVTILVLPANDPPTATSQDVETNEDTPRAITLGGSDPEGAALNFTVVGLPAHGVLSGAGNTRTYTPNANFFGSDSFRYSVSDGSLHSESATVQITVNPVNDAPTAQGGAAQLAEDNAGAILLPASDPEGSLLTYTVVSGPSHGLLTGTGGSRTYSPAANYFGPDALVYQVSDGALTSGHATVTITVQAINDPPVAIGQALSTNEDTPLAITLSASDIEGSALSYSLSQLPSHGTLTGTGSSRSYIPETNFAGADSFSFVADDGAAQSAGATIQITVLPINDPPRAFGDTLLIEDSGATPVLFDALDPEGAPLTYTLVSGPNHGLLSGTGAVRSYTPGPGYLGLDEVTFRVSDGALNSADATVTLVVVPMINNPPTADAGADQSIEATGPLTPAALQGSGDDQDGDALTYTWRRGATVLATSASAVVSLPPGLHSLILAVSDPSGDLAEDDVAVLIRDTTAPTVTHPANVSAVQNTPAGAVVTFAITATDAVSNPVVECSPASGSEFPLGTTTVVCTARDAAGNLATRSFNVRVSAPPVDSGKVTAKATVNLGSETG